MHRSEFIKALRAELPAVEPWLKGYRDNLTIEMDRVLDFTHAAIKARDYNQLGRIFDFMERAYVGGDAKLKNSIAVTYLAKLDFGQRPPDIRAQSLLGRSLAAERHSVLKAQRDSEHRSGRTRGRAV